MAMMRSVLFFSLVMGIGGAVSASAQAPTEMPWSGRSEVASSGDFSVMQLATIDPEGLNAEWAKCTPGVHLNTNSQMKRNQPIVTFVAFKGCKADAKGNCQLVGSFDVLDPNGKSYTRQADAKIWVDHPPAPNLNIQMSEAALGLVIEDKDPLGPYKVMVTVVARVAGVTLHTEQVLTAVP
jgi:hypothetical protein